MPAYDWSLELPDVRKISTRCFLNYKSAFFIYFDNKLALKKLLSTIVRSRNCKYIILGILCDASLPEGTQDHLNAHLWQWKWTQNNGNKWQKFFRKGRLSAILLWMYHKIWWIKVHTQLPIPLLLSYAQISSLCEFQWSLKCEISLWPTTLE